MFDTPQAPQQQGGSSKNGRHEHASKPPQQQGGFPQKWQTRECLAALTATGRLHPKMADMSVSKPAAGGLNAAPADFLFTQCAEELRDQSTLYCLGPSPTALCVRLSPAGSAAPAGVSARQQERPLRTCTVGSPQPSLTVFSKGGSTLDWRLKVLPESKDESAVRVHWELALAWRETLERHDGTNGLPTLRLLSLPGRALPVEERRACRFTVPDRMPCSFG